MSIPIVTWNTYISWPLILNLVYTQTKQKIIHQTNLYKKNAIKYSMHPHHYHDIRHVYQNFSCVYMSAASSSVSQPTQTFIPRNFSSKTYNTHKQTTVAFTTWNIYKLIPISHKKSIIEIYIQTYLDRCDTSISHTIRDYNIKRVRQQIHQLQGHIKNAYMFVCVCVPNNNCRIFCVLFWCMVNNFLDIMMYDIQMHQQ